MLLSMAEWGIYSEYTTPSLAQINAYRLFGTKPLSKPMLHITIGTHRNKFQWNLNQNAKIYIQENEIRNVICKMAAILSVSLNVLKQFST